MKPVVRVLLQSVREALSAPLDLMMLVLLVILVSACGGEVTCSTFAYEDPLLVIEEAKDRANGAPVTPLRLTAFRYRGQAVEPAALLLTDQAHGVSLDQDRLICTPACGFAGSPGFYEFTVGAEGYRDTTLAVEAGYSRSEGSCPMRLAEGVMLKLTLSKLP